jgi:hypothetical protein
VWYNFFSILSVSTCPIFSDCKPQPPININLYLL